MTTLGLGSQLSAQTDIDPAMTSSPLHLSINEVDRAKFGLPPLSVLNSEMAHSWPHSMMLSVVNNLFPLGKRVMPPYLVLAMSAKPTSYLPEWKGCHLVPQWWWLQGNLNYTERTKIPY